MQSIESSLSEFGEVLKITDYQDSDSGARSLKINICTEDPTAIFDVCAEFGKIKSIKIGDSS